MAGISGIELVIHQNQMNQNAPFTIVNAVCPAGKVALGGGFSHTTSPLVQVTRSAPMVDSGTGLAKGWSVQVILSSEVGPEGGWYALAYATCANAS